MKKITEWFINLYALWIVLSYVIGYFYPWVFEWFARGSWTTGALSVVLLSMGLTLKVDDFKMLFRSPRVVGVAAMCQYTILPFSGWMIATLLNLPPAFYAGLILMACVPAGTASNLIAYIGRANVALSVISTAVSTVLGIFMTPLLCKWLAGQTVEVDAWKMFFDMIKVVLIPVTLGVFINYKFPQFVNKIGQTGPVLSTVAIFFISGAVIAAAGEEGRHAVIQYFWTLIIAATLLHGMGFGLGYAVSSLLGYKKSISRSISAETGMQNGGLAAVLARRSFPEFGALAALPAAFCSVMMTVIGGILATIWRLTYKEEPGDDLKRI